MRTILSLYVGLVRSGQNSGYGCRWDQQVRSFARLQCSREPAEQITPAVLLARMHQVINTKEGVVVQNGDNKQQSCQVSIAQKPCVLYYCNIASLCHVILQILAGYIQAPVQPSSGTAE